MDKNIKLLLVEDDEVDRLTVIRSLKHSEIHFDIHEALDFHSASNVLKKEQFDCILLDYILPDRNGIELIDHIAKEAPVILLTGIDDESIGFDAIKNGVQDYINKKELTSNLLLRSIRYAIERHRMAVTIQKLSMIDELTNLYNRRGFMLLSKKLITLANRNNHKILLIFADFDNLKFYNDNNGHIAGDQALKNSASIIKGAFRTSDIVARLGGDEFVVFAMETESENSETMIKRLKENINEFNLHTENSLPLSLSIGTACYDPQQPCSIEELLCISDKRMYEQKKLRKNVLCKSKLYVSTYEE